jgi:hypothetical protein
MNKLKGVLPLIVGLLFMGGLTFVNNQNVKADGDPPNCYYDEDVYDCDYTSATTCWCITVDPGEGG